MTILARGWRRFAVQLVGGLTLPLALVLEAPAQAPETPAGSKEVAAAPAAALSLSDCIRVALEQQPTLTANRATLESAEAARHGLYRLPSIPLLPSAKELPIRRKQADVGVGIAHAVLTQSEQETVYAVVRN